MAAAPPGSPRRRRLHAFEGALRAESTRCSGELRCGASTTIGQYLLPPLLGHFQKAQPSLLDHNRQILIIANFLMAVAMAGMGFQVDFGRLRANGPRAVTTALIGWLVLLALAIGETWLLTKF